MKSVVITGSSRGLGYALAESFLREGCAVTLNGRSVDRLDQAASRLRATYGVDRVAARAGDAASSTDLEALSDAALRANLVDAVMKHVGVIGPIREWLDRHVYPAGPR